MSIDPEDGEDGRSRRATDLGARFSLLDPLRILASVAVVWHHSTRGYLFGVGFGLFLFLVIMFALASSGTRKEPLAAFARRKAGYILVPWLRWSAIYVIILVAADLLRGDDPRGRFEPGMVFYGGHRTLWFLPFAALALGPVKALSLRASRTSARKAVIAAALLGAVATNAAAFVATLDIPDLPWRAWARATPAIFWGIAVGQSLRAGERERPGLLALVALCGIAAYALSPWRSLPDDLPRRFAVALPLACLGFAWRPEVPRPVRQLSTVTFGVYLVHPLVAKFLATAFEVGSWTTLEHAGLVWFGAALIVLGLRRLAVPWHECAVPRAA